MKNLYGLTEEEYSLVFDTDWNAGPESKMSSMDRVRIHELYLKYLHNFFKEKKEFVEEKVIQGFID